MNPLLQQDTMSPAQGWATSSAHHLTRMNGEAPSDGGMDQPGHPPYLAPYTMPHRHRHCHSRCRGTAPQLAHLQLNLAAWHPKGLSIGSPKRTSGFTTMTVTPYRAVAAM